MSKFQCSLMHWKVLNRYRFGHERGFLFVINFPFRFSYELVE